MYKWICQFAMLVYQKVVHEPSLFETMARNGISFFFDYSHVLAIAKGRTKQLIDLIIRDSIAYILPGWWFQIFLI